MMCHDSCKCSMGLGKSIWRISYPLKKEKKNMATCALCGLILLSIYQHIVWQLPVKVSHEIQGIHPYTTVWSQYPHTQKSLLCAAKHMQLKHSKIVVMSSSLIIWDSVHKMILSESSFGECVSFAIIQPRYRKLIILAAVESLLGMPLY